MTRRDAILLAVAAVLVALPLFLVGSPSSGGRFDGADSQAVSLAGKLSPGFKPWARPLYTPPSPEIQSLLFAAQAGIACGFLGYYVGLRVARVRAGKDDAA